MKKIIVVVLCIVQVSCLAMYKENKSELLKRQTKSTELLAVSHALQTCLQVQEYNKTAILQYDAPCLSLNPQCIELIKKQTNK